MSGQAITVDRLVATAAALLTLAGVIIGGLALARRRRHDGTRGGKLAVVAGATGTIVGGLVVITADGGPGTGNGIVGGYAAVAIGLIAMLLGALALGRPPHTT